MTDLLSQTPLNREQLDLVDTLRSSEQAIQSLLDAMLDIARIESGSLQLESRAVSLPALMADCAELVRPPALAQGLLFKMQIDPHMPVWVRGDHARLQQILNTLATLILDSVAKSGIGLSLVPETDQRMCLTIASIGGAAVHDFVAYSLQPSTLGGGFSDGSLGVMIADRLIHAMGGNLYVASLMGQWEAFQCHLPMERCDPPHIQASLETAASLPHFRVLIAEDIPVNQMLASHLLKRLGMEVVDIVANGEEALEAVMANEYDVVLMDVGMPMMDGIEATRAIRLLGPKYRQPYIIAVTADAFDENREACLAAGMNDFVSKPFRRDDLIQCLCRVGQVTAP